ncbi:serine/threonine-protein phosphatase CPPED1-like [Tigriopus californicus]|uniref:serine/threonine-protein phosphatase CPPED1-like n=1 Tax=Tigriopus californicus TaxID=6832 RepID=UPI0027DA4FF2|nr:serine/threonine-protein phosphatase CPPED1-like [Tigriopus californicus]
MHEETAKEDLVPSSDLVVHKAENRILPIFEKSLNEKWTEPFYFIQAADTQLGLIVNYGDGTINDQYPNITWEKEIELCRQSVEIINNLDPKPKFFIICGDLLDAMPDLWPDIRKRQQDDFMRVYSDLDPSIPLVCVCGNHDVGNTPTKETIANYQASFGDDYFSFWVGGAHFLVLNSQYFEDASQVPDLALAQERWLNEQLQMSNDLGSQHIVLFQHIPWFVQEPKEDKIYFNIEINCRTRMLSKFKKHGVSKIFCGHYHRNAGGWDENLELVVTTAIGCQIGNDFHGMRIVRVMENDIQHDFYGLDDFPQKIDLNPTQKTKETSSNKSNLDQKCQRSSPIKTTSTGHRRSSTRP